MRNLMKNKLFTNAIKRYITQYSNYHDKANFTVYIKKKYPRFFKYINNYTHGTKFNHKLFNVLHGITDNPTCKICHSKPVSFINVLKGYKTYCSDICSSKDPELWEKRRTTMVEHFGCEYPLQNPEILKKTKVKLKETFAENGEGRKNYINSMIATYGVTNPMELEEFRNKITVSHSLRTPEDKKQTTNKTKQTKLLKYGNKNYNNTCKAKKTIKSKYNVEYIGQIHTSKKWLEITDKKEFLIQTLPSLHPLKIAKDYNIAFSTLYTLINKLELKDLIRKTFNGEFEIKEYLKSLNISYSTNNKAILNGLELDILINDYNLAIEHNGVYWHSVQNGKKYLYHLNKTLGCEQNNITLFHIFDFEWINSKEIIQSLIKQKLNIYNSIILENFYIQPIDDLLKNSFLTDNNLFGIVESDLNLGLFVDNKLTQLLTFYNSEITSFSTDINYDGIIDYSYLFDFYINNYSPEHLKITINRRFDFKEIFINFGFSIISYGLPKLLSFGSDQIWDSGYIDLIWYKK